MIADFILGLAALVVVFGGVALFARGLGDFAGRAITRRIPNPVPDIGGGHPLWDGNGA